MKTYTVDADGVPALAFRAKDDDAAATWLTGWVGKWYAGTFAVRNKALKSSGDDAGTGSVACPKRQDAV